jgi:hypothetical protein
MVPRSKHVYRFIGARSDGQEQEGGEEGRAMAADELEVARIDAIH